MKKKINLIFALIFVMAIVPFTSAQTLQDNSQNIDNDVSGNIGVNSSGWDGGQYFQAQSTYYLDKISLYQWIPAGVPDNCLYEVDIYRTNASGSPIYLLTRNFTYSNTSFIESTFPDWRNVTFPDRILIEEGGYYGVFLFELIGNERGIIWWHDDNNDTYPYGSAVVNTGVGGETNGAWRETKDTSFAYFYDYAFMMWGEETTIAPTNPNQQIVDDILLLAPLIILFLMGIFLFAFFTGKGEKDLFLIAKIAVVSMFILAIGAMVLFKLGNF